MAVHEGRRGGGEGLQGPNPKGESGQSTAARSSQYRRWDLFVGLRARLASANTLGGYPAPPPPSNPTHTISLPTSSPTHTHIYLCTTQGREKDICIFSAVRSPPAPKKGARRAGIGFVADERRINVGLTRARCSLIVIGNVRALQVRC